MPYYTSANFPYCLHCKAEPEAFFQARLCSECRMKYDTHNVQFAQQFEAECKQDWIEFHDKYVRKAIAAHCPEIRDNVAGYLWKQGLLRTTVTDIFDSVLACIDD